MILVDVQVAGHQHQRIAGVLVDKLANHLAALDAGLPAAVIPMRVQPQHLTPGASPRSRSRTQVTIRGSELSQLLLPGNIGRLAQPERAGVERLEAGLLVERRGEFTLSLAVVAPDADDLIVGELLLQEVGLRSQHFLRAEQVGIELANRRPTSNSLRLSQEFSLSLAVP